jgi:hypothetical protein
MKAGPGAHLARGAMGFFLDVPDDGIHQVAELQNGAAKYAIALGIYKLTLLIAVGFFKILNLGGF